MVKSVGLAARSYWLEGAQGAWLGSGRPLEGKVPLLSLILDRRCRATRTVVTRETGACGRGAVGVLAEGANRDTNTASQQEMVP